MDCYKLTLTEYTYPSKSSYLIMDNILNKVYKALVKPMNKHSFGVRYFDNDNFPKEYYIITTDRELLDFLTLYYQVEPTTYRLSSAGATIKIDYDYTGNANFFYQ